ncbi:cysteine hydrolase family protein [Glutamicibacter sp. PAEs-4]|uniref:cysteine hydrolase family protein n=1 Tax=Glutamicibacter sp. PAEs-4 TaxID=3444114 RepID=UPI003EBEAFA8
MQSTGRGGGTGRGAGDQRAHRAQGRQVHLNAEDARGWPGLLFEGTAKAGYLEELELAGAIEVVKRRDSAFWNTELTTLLLQRRASSLVLAGVATDTCIRATASDAFAANLPVAVATDA